MCVNSEQLTLSIKEAMGQNVEILTQTKWQLIMMGMSNFIKFGLRCDSKRICY